MNDKTPRIRFKGFTDDWEQRKLSEFVEFFSGLTYTPNDVQESGTLVLRSSNVNNSEIVDADNVYVNPQVVNSEMVKVGDIIVVVRNGSRSLIGKHAQIKTFMPNTVIGAFMTGIRSECPEFTNALLNTSKFEKEIAMNMGATINQITGYMFSRMEFKIPCINEQKKIGEYFDNLDNLITLHQRKCEVLVNIKKSMLEKIFPKNGKKVPEIRFEGFTDDWEQRKLGEITMTNPFKQFIAEGTLDGTYEVIQQGDIPVVGYANGEPFENYERISLFGDHTLSLYKPKGPFFVASDGIKILSPSINLDGLFYYYLLMRYKPNSEGYKRHYTILKDCEALYPTDCEEQKQIGVLFQQLDNLITLHQRKLEKLQNIKKSMLEQMFI